MDILVHASLREGLARALPQALAAGKPVVAYDCDGASEVCLPEETGLLVRPGDRDGLRAAVLRLSRDAALRERFGKAGRELVRAEFPVQKMVDDIYRLYERLLAQNQGLAGSHDC
jgi:glycosyltransferase involved in cell wall biosynthesis